MTLNDPGSAMSDETTFFGQSGEVPVDERLAALLSITGRMDGFLYRCRNDANYTMLYIHKSWLPQ